MKTDFLCPQCQGYLSVDNKIIFTVRAKGSRAGILILSPILGDYSYLHNPAFTIALGEELEFHCPICHTNLTVPGASQLAKVVMREEDRYEYFIVFSRREGEKCTYKLSEKKMETFGEDAHRYVNFLNASLMK